MTSSGCRLRRRLCLSKQARLRREINAFRITREDSRGNRLKPGIISRLTCRRDGVRDTHFGSRLGIRNGPASLPQMPARGAKRWICIRANAGSRQMRRNRRPFSKEMRDALLHQPTPREQTNYFLHPHIMDSASTSTAIRTPDGQRNAFSASLRGAVMALTEVERMMI